MKKKKIKKINDNNNNNNNIDCDMNMDMDTNNIKNNIIEQQTNTISKNIKNNLNTNDKKIDNNDEDDDIIYLNNHNKNVIVSNNNDKLKHYKMIFDIENENHQFGMNLEMIQKQYNQLSLNQKRVINYLGNILAKNKNGLSEFDFYRQKYVRTKFVWNVLIRYEWLIDHHVDIFRDILKYHFNKNMYNTVLLASNHMKKTFQIIHSGGAHWV